MSDIRILECGLEYAKMGWQVLPLYGIKDGKCGCGKDGCSSPGKHPALRNGSKDASSDEDQIRKWFSSDHNYNIGICAGAESGLVILDVDPAHGGDDSLDKYKVPETLEVITGSGGRHFYFAHPGGDIRNSAGKLGPGLDVRGFNGYCVAPPSMHVCGVEYRWKVDPRARQAVACPSWIDEKPVSNDKPPEGADIPKGKRNNALASIAGAMRRQGCGSDAIHTALISVNQARCKPPLGFKELKRIADSIAGYPPEENGQGFTVLYDENPETIAAAFESASKAKHAYNAIDGWSIYKDGRYRPVDDDEIQVYLRRFLNNVRIRKKNEKQVKYRRSIGKIRDIMAELAALNSVEIPKNMNSPSSLDGRFNPRDIIAMHNCLLDISTFPAKQIPLSKEFYTLNYLPFAYDPAAKCPMWIAFLESIFLIYQLSNKTEWSAQADDFIEVYEHIADELAISILQEWFGYFVSGQTHLQKIFGLIGERRSGKSTIGKVLRALIGSSNAASPTLTGLATEFGLQALINKTVAIIGDANTGGRNGEVSRAVERLKSISGEDGQQINRKNKSYVEVDKLPVRFLLIANKMQDLRDSTGALASRFNFLVTTQSFLGREDTHLEQRLMTELPGIFNWALEGLRRLIERGCIPEHPVGIETREDFEEMSSPMMAFVNDWCEVRNDVMVPVDILWKAHCNWAKENGNKSYSKRKFIIEVKGACCTVRRDRQRLNLSHLRDVYNWDTGLGDNRMSVLSGIDLSNSCRKKWDTGDMGTGYGTGYPY